MSIKKYIPKPLRKILSMAYNKMFCFKNRAVNKLDGVFYPNEMKYYCPCCESRLKDHISLGFEKHGNVYDPERYKGIDQNVICPVCYSLPRHRILAAWLDEHKSEFSGKILYFAVEPGIVRWMKRNKVDFSSADLYNEADLKLDIENTEQPDESWDWVICNHVLEHVYNYRKALEEMYRILKPGGTLICSFPILENQETLIEETEHTEENKTKRLKLYGQFDHLRIFGRDSEELLRSIGFEVTKIDGNKMPEEIYPVIGPADYDVNYLFLCRK